VDQSSLNIIIDKLYSGAHIIFYNGTSHADC